MQTPFIPVLFLLLWAVPVAAEGLPSIVIGGELTYQECFALAQQTLNAEADALTRGQEPEATTPQNLPPLAGGVGFGQALENSGVHLMVDPANPAALPKVVFESPPVAAATTPPEATPPTAADLAAQTRHLCRVKFGLQF